MLASVIISRGWLGTSMSFKYDLLLEICLSNRYMCESWSDRACRKILVWLTGMVGIFSTWRSLCKYTMQLAQETDILRLYFGFQGGMLVVKNPLPANVGSARDAGLIPGSGRFPEKEMATPSSILAWRIPWTEEPGGLQSMGSRRVRHDWAQHKVGGHIWWTASPF